MNRSKKIGSILCALPFVLLVITFVGYTIARIFIRATPASSVVGAGGLGQASSATTYALVAKAIFGLTGLLGVIGLFICVPLSIYFFARTDKGDAQPGNTSPKGTHF